MTADEQPPRLMQKLAEWTFYAFFATCYAWWVGAQVGIALPLWLITRLSGGFFFLVGIFILIDLTQPEGDEPNASRTAEWLSRLSAGIFALGLMALGVGQWMK